MYNGNSVSISVSDDDSDDVGKARTRIRRKRKKPGLRIKNDWIWRIVRKLLKWWMVWLFLPAAGLLIYEAYHIGRKPVLVIDSHRPSAKKLSFPLERKPNPNLNRLDPTTRVVGGVRERKFLPQSVNGFLIFPLVSDEQISHSESGYFPMI